MKMLSRTARVGDVACAGRQLVANPRYRVTLRLWVSYVPKHGNRRNIGFYRLHLPG